MIKTLAVIGAGQMGTGIAQVAAQAAKIPRVLLYDNSPTQLSKQLANLQSSLQRAVGKGKLTKEECDATLQAVKGTGKLEDIGSADFIIEVNKTQQKNAHFPES
jgi:3-hydroxybutyryl-CoA dehydrogenase